MSEIKVDTVAEKTSANGVTVDGLNIKDSKLVTANSVVETNLTDNIVTLAKMASGTDGNIISYDASGNPVAIATGSDGQVLTSTGAGSPPAFEALPGGGKILQVLHMSYGTGMDISNDSGNGTTSNLTLNITPASTSNKILVLPNISSRTPATNRGYGIRIMRGSTSVYDSGYHWLDVGGADNVRARSSWQYLDSPSSTSQITYTINILTESGNTMGIHPQGTDSFLTLMEVAG
jgi:hypothetical protein